MTTEPKSDWPRFWLATSVAVNNLAITTVTTNNALRWVFIVLAIVYFCLAIACRSPRLFFRWFTRMLWNALRGEV